MQTQQTYISEKVRNSSNVVINPATEWTLSTIAWAIHNEDEAHIDKKIEEIPTTDLSPIESSIWIAKDNIIDTIKSTENEVCNDIKTVNKELQEDNVSTRQLLRQKTKKLDENVSKLADRQRMVDEAIEHESEEIESEIERILQEEVDMIENEQFNQEAQEIESELSNQETNGNT